MKKILDEPLLHFLAIGLALFALYAAAKDARREPATIVVGEAQIAPLREVFERTWRRAPSAEELRSLIEGHVREEVLYREGVALGLDRDDSLIRRRVRQKVEFLSESLHGVPEPTEAALQAYLDAHRERYQADARFTFEQVSLGTGPTLLEARMDRAPFTDVTRVFGRRFAEALAGLSAGAWHAPVASAYGAHRVRVLEREPARVPALAEVREPVKRDWLRDELAAAGEKYYASLRSRYEVRIQ